MRIVEITAAAERWRPSREQFLASVCATILTGCQKVSLDADTPLQYGLAVERLDGLMLYEENTRRGFPAASLTKLLIALTAVSVMDLDSEITIGRLAYAAANRFLPSAHVGSRISLRKLLRYMISESDNFSANVLIGELGVVAINDCAGAMRLTVSGIHGPYYDTSAALTPRAFTTAQESNEVLRQMISRARSGSNRSNRYLYLLECMLMQSDRRFIPYVSCRNVPVANKTGEIRDELNDSAIIDPFGPSPILFTVLAHGSFDVSRDVNRYNAAVLAVIAHVERVYKMVVPRPGLCL
jgi:beta-lactamase class A